MIKKTIENISEPNQAAIALAKKRSQELLTPLRALGELLTIAEKVAGITGTLNADLSRKAIAVMAGDHGVTAEGVSAYPSDITGLMVQSFVKGMAAINSLAKSGNIDVKVIDMGCKADFSALAATGAIIDKKVKSGTDNFAQGPAMSQKEAQRSVENGISIAQLLIDQGYTFIGTGDMGIGNTTPSTAIAATVSGKPVREITGKGAGLDDAGLQKKIAIIEKALLLNKPDPAQGMELLAKMGGFEIGGIAGVVLGCAAHKIPVVIDGVISTAGACIAYLLCPRVKEYMFVAHESEEKAQRAMLEFMGLQSMLNFHMRLGEGSGCALAMPIIEAAIKVHGTMATFADAGIAQ
ncbi:MAG: nicotinate-nucleotide--dimethylbenzimidazole phosphoribosyltransferase [Candidatus Raymondbacteria bacterium RifOxyA12_full_50_37]|uniref:Nicotinate-nucleotide--dimethylbenzimidazole phosphoribosyltransferase n=1 Tax=Candidatus Raymondbacteria bacterium RIFOXYD12_FULL_49_13 TaxID=1817890 RepID=A0A1F7FKJ8_UNCRA|nr:MAG: nicotinate-nucleotide--dimethylbenzimidazole phosphoribosyltransferase [Candidatus Raymondbacteria bacterium RifOxyA12_full_50_37]OGJ90143.1 MAG: nicotinate-nucleotide--dimethylbenzimidazole phosphoribosyltransferase [Candidatus Raymondbacteria bacterium RIFOXYA2_FULL_49_16]OGJ97214.1 MAG: nicotinate-nucleotide--dimethylbenzimidazole phosphoribosyltransferase [Candidatus Raymondbacteria bacterium RIFOXYC2_FULL_50_21]OGK04482.1 MAG: nicotinate-nucleotide--dimethylbenzimidazole phosphoribo